MPKTGPVIQPGAPPLERMISYRVSRIQAKLNAQATRILKTHAELSPNQWRVLVILEPGGNLTTAEIARMTGSDKGLLSRVVNGMLERGLISSRPSKANRRHQLLRITPAGIAAHERAQPHMKRRHDALIGALSEGEREAFFTAIAKIEAEIDRS